jgi:hypothetical protein
MRHVRLVSFEDEPTGSLGLIFKGCEGPSILSDSDGSLIAHDLVEHQNGINAIGCIADELQAIGAIWQVRARHGDMVDEDRPWARWRAIHDSIAGNVLTCAMDLGNEGQDWWPELGKYRTNRHDYDDDFLEILECAKPMIRAETRDNEDRFPMAAFMDNALHLLRIGFNKSRRRWGDDTLGVDTFRAVKRAINPHAKYLEFPGQEFRLSYGNGEARCTALLHADDAW